MTYVIIDVYARYVVGGRQKIIWPAQEISRSLSWSRGEAGTRARKADELLLLKYI